MDAPTLPIHEAGQRAGLPAWGELPDSRDPGWAYTDQALYREELERFFYCGHWCYVGPECEIAKAGDFKRTQLGERSVIVVRDNAGAVRRGQVRTKSVNDTCAAAQAGQHHQLIGLRPVIRQHPLVAGSDIRESAFCPLALALAFDLLLRRARQPTTSRSFACAWRAQGAHSIVDG